MVLGVFEEVALKPGPESVKSQDKSRQKEIVRDVEGAHYEQNVATGGPWKPDKGLL